MTERTPAPHRSWELAPISDALGADWDFSNDPVLGTRVHYRLPAPETFPTEFDLYPDTGLVHVATPDSHIALGRQKPPVITTDQVVFSQDKDGLTTDLTIARGGLVTLTSYPDRARGRARGLRRPAKRA